MTYVLAGLIVAVPAIWLLGIHGRLVECRIDLEGRDPSGISWDSSKRFDPSRYNAEGEILLRWYRVSHVALVLAVGVALWLLVRKGLL